MSVEELFQDNELVRKANDYIRRHKINELFEVSLYQMAGPMHTCVLPVALKSGEISN